MTQRSRLRGHRIHMVGECWYYTDTGEPAEGNRRPCGFCHRPDREDDHDACIPNLPDTVSACCGHGDAQEAFIQRRDGSRIEGHAAIQVMRACGVGPTRDQPNHGHQTARMEIRYRYSVLTGLQSARLIPPRVPPQSERGIRIVPPLKARREVVGHAVLLCPACGVGYVNTDRATGERQPLPCGARWTGIPCDACGATFTVEVQAADFDRIKIVSE